MEPTLAAPQSKGHVSVARMTDYWYVVARSSDLAKGQVTSKTLLGIPLVLCRNEEGQVGAMLDRCPHRNVPLSAGAIKGKHLQCPYHGWEFKVDGACAHIPGLLSESDAPARNATSFPVVEQQSYIWVYANPDKVPETKPYDIPHLDDSRYTHAHRFAEAEGTLHATIENALDVPHTSYLHKGLFRGGDRNEIEVVVKRWSDRVEAEYIGEPRPKGLVAKLLAPGGGEVTHYDRFLLPSIGQVEYKIGDGTHFLVTSLCTPIGDFHTEIYAIVSYRLGRMPGWSVKPVLEPMARKIFAQDARILKMQTDVIKRFGGEQFASTEIDVLGGDIWRLMKAAARNEAAPDDKPAIERRLRMSA